MSDTPRTDQQDATEATEPDSSDKTGRYAERLYVTWYLWPLPLIAAGLLAAEIHMGYPGVRAWLPYVLILPLTLLLIIRSGRTRIEIVDGELRVGDATLPLRHVGEAMVVPPKAKRSAMGPHLDPSAFVVHRGWVGPLVRVQVVDDDDPTPYWQFSTRHPDQVLAALRAR